VPDPTVIDSAAVTPAPFALEVRDLQQSYPTPSGKLEVLRGLNFRLEPGLVLAVIGPSGSGKSTLLHLIGGLETPSSGEVIWNGSSLHGLNQDALAARRANEVGLVFQHHYLLEDLTALENVAIPGLIAGRPDQDRARALLARVGLSERAAAFPATLSGGERQRCALARALLTRPRLVLADEPTGSLDRANAERMFELLIDLAHEEGAAVVVVTHDQALSERADRMLHLLDGQILET
jgi:lipoprotein-releasing system ATP-binding protein